MLDVKRRSGDVRAFVGALEHWIIAALARLGVAGEIATGPRRHLGAPARARARDLAEDKIAAIGLRLQASG